MKSITMKLSPLNLTILTFLTTAAIASEQKTEILAPIVVTASGSSQEFRDAPASISVINQEQLKKRPSYRLENALQDIPGVNLSGSNANRADISIRGLPADYTLIMVDGHRQNTRESRPNGNGGFEGGFIPLMLLNVLRS